jgi:hypothetical protein
MSADFKMSTRQAKSIARIRADRRAKKLCFDCGIPSPHFRCEDCNAKRRDSMRELMQQRRAR